MQGGILPGTGLRQFPYDMDYSDGVGTGKPRLGTIQSSGGDCVNGQFSSQRQNARQRCDISMTGVSVR
jgi:hypothetical protein